MSSFSTGGCTNNDTIGGGAKNDDVSNAEPAASLRGAIAAADEVNTAGNNNLAAMDDHHGGDDVAGELGKMCGNTHEIMTLKDISAAHSPNNRKDANDKEDQSSHYSPLTSPMNYQSLSEDDNSVSTPIKESQATAIISNKTTTTIKNSTSTNTTTNDNQMHTTNTNNNNSSIIKPQSKESIQHLEFSSHSFSVPSITKKTPFVSNNYQYDDDDFGGGGTALSFGIGPSLDTLKEEAENTFEQEKSCEKKLLPKEEKEEEEQEQPPSTTTIATTLNPNAQWLYNKCSIAKSKMEYPHSTLHLSTKILTAIRQHCSSNNNHDSSSSSDDEEEQSQKMQNVLFKLIDEGKKRDLQFIGNTLTQPQEPLQIN